VVADEGLEGEATDLLIEALNEVNKAIEADPSSAEAYAYQAEILFDLGRYDEADEAIDNALLIDSDSLDAQRTAGYLMEFRGYRAQAIEHYEEAIRLHPKLAMLYQALGRTYIGAGEIDLAMDSLETALELEPDNPEYLYWLGYANFAIGGQDLAADYFKQALEIQPSYPAAQCQTRNGRRGLWRSGNVSKRLLLLYFGTVLLLPRSLRRGIPAV
jgi:tetratricopeptide (TPR) repeat protein